MIEVRISDALKKLSHGSRFTVKLNRQKTRLVLSTPLFRVEARTKEGKRREKKKEKENAYNVKRSEPASLERSRYMSGFPPWEPLARTLGAEDSLFIYMYLHVYRIWWPEERIW